MLSQSNNPTRPFGVFGVDDLTGSSEIGGSVSIEGPATVNQGTSPWITQEVQVRGTLTDRSGTIVSGGVAQILVAANPSRNYLTIQNNGSDNLWFNFTTTATTSRPSFILPPGAAWTSDPQFVSTELVSIISSTTGTTWTSKEG